MRCASPSVIRAPDSQTEFKKVPCGKCYACKTNRRTEWTIRLKEEMHDHIDAVFVTLTYADESLITDDCGAHVDKKELQDFFKRLRKSIAPRKIRYYAVGEYGSNTFRPHYHAIIFGLHPSQAHVIEKAWSLKKVPIGGIHCVRANERTIGYVTKYHVNKGKEPIGLSPSFTLMSRKPAIGAGYIDRMKKWHQKDINRNYHSEFQNKQGLPRYYREKIFSKQDRRTIERKFRRDEFELEEVEKFEKKYPNENFWKLRMQQKQDRERAFKEKSEFNQKL